MKGKLRALCAQRFPRVVVFALALSVVFAATFRSMTNPVRAQVTSEGEAIYQFSNPAPIIIPNGGVANPYPSTINVANAPIQIAKITVTLNSITHAVPQDIDVMVVGPQGQTAIIMSDAGGFMPASGERITFDDEAPTFVPSPLTTGTFKPTNLQVGDTFPAPAPAPVGNPPLSVFNGTNPNGEWRLFVVDDVDLDNGSIGLGWAITITPAISGQNTGAITIPDNGMASPYPSEITITNHNDRLSRVSLTLTNFSHSSPDDVDIMLVSPSGRAVVVMSDVGGATPVNNLNLVIDDFAPSPLPDNAPLSSGIFRPADAEPGESFPAPAPSGVTMGRTLASLNGTVGNGTWRLFVVDDAGNNVGNISGGWNLLLGTFPGTISMQGANIAMPYPSEISVSGLPGLITRATVRINNFSHLSPDEVDIMMVSPDGRRIVLMSDAGGTSEAGGVDLVFDDAAPTPVPDNAPVTTGTYRPSNYEPGDVFPPPAPAGAPTGTTLSSLFGAPPNGTWRLYVVNDGAASGSIAGVWSVSFETSVNACIVSVSPLVQGFPSNGGSGSFNILQPTGCAWMVSTTDAFISITSASSGGGNSVVNFSIAPNNGPPRTGTIEVSNGIASRSFNVQQASGCPFSVGQSTVNFRAIGGTGNVSVSADGSCGWQGSTSASWIQITSQQQNGNGSLVFNVQPNPSRAARTATINLGTQIITVNQAGTRSTPFDFNGDARTDISVFRPANATWWIANSGGGVSAYAFGIPTDRIVPADFDGDFKTDIAVYRQGTWYVLRSSDGTFAINSWGTSSDIPLPADYNADGSAELAVFRPATGQWWILNSNGTFTSAAFGIPTDLPTPADYDGDGSADLSVYRTAMGPGESGRWWILNSSTGTISQYAFGIQGDVPVAADYDGDGRENVALFRPSTGTWYRSTNAATNFDAVQFGISTDRTVAGDYDGDGKSDPAVFRQGVWYVLGSSSGVQITQFGTTGDIGLPNAYVP